MAQLKLFRAIFEHGGLVEFRFSPLFHEVHMIKGKTSGFWANRKTWYGFQNFKEEAQNNRIFKLFFEKFSV